MRTVADSTAGPARQTDTVNSSIAIMLPYASGDMDENVTCTDIRAIDVFRTFSRPTASETNAPANMIQARTRRGTPTVFGGFAASRNASTGDMPPTTRTVNSEPTKAIANPKTIPQLHARSMPVTSCGRNGNPFASNCRVANG